MHVDTAVNIIPGSWRVLLLFLQDISQQMQEKNEEYIRLSDREGILQKEQEAMRNEKVSQSFDSTGDFMVFFPL